MTHLKRLAVIAAMGCTDGEIADPNDLGMGGQFGQTEDCGAPTVTPFDIDEEAPNGLAAADLVGGNIPDVSATAAFDDGTETDIAVQFSAPMNAAYIEYDSTEPECEGRLTFELTASMTTADARLDEVTTMTVRAFDAADIAAFSVLTDIDGTLDPADFTQASYDAIEVHVLIDFAQPTSGTLTGVGTNGDPDGDLPVLAETFPIASF